MWLIMTQDKRLQRLMACALTRILAPDLDVREIEFAADDPATDWRTGWTKNGVQLWASFPNPMHALESFYRHIVAAAAFNRVAPCIDPIYPCPHIPVPEYIRNMADAAYAEDGIDSDRLRVMWDALEDVGIECEQLRLHLQCDTGHWRGCWALEALRNGH